MVESTRHRSSRRSRGSGNLGISVACPRPRCRGCQEIADGLDRYCASFEASLREAPQDEEFLNSISELPYAEERPRAPLEARMALLQRFFVRTGQFPDSLFRGGDGLRGLPI